MKRELLETIFQDGDLLLGKYENSKKLHCLCFSAIATQFGLGCSSVVSMTVLENDRQGYRCFIGLFDPSVRPYIGTNELSFTIPFSRFTRMTGTMKECFLFDSHAWKNVKARLEE